MAVPVVIVEDDPRYRKSVETLLRHTPDLTFVAGYGLIGEALAAARTGARDWGLVLMDLELPDGSGADAIRRLKEIRADLPILALTVFESPRTVLETICAGADGYLLKRATAPELLGAIRALLAGGSPLTPATARALLEVVRKTSAPPSSKPTRLDLSEREQSVLRGLAAGRAYKQVADDLGVSLDTVRTHIRSLYRKLQVHSVAEAVTRALREGLV